MKYGTGGRTRTDTAGFWRPACSPLQHTGNWSWRGIRTLFSPFTAGRINRICYDQINLERSAGLEPATQEVEAPCSFPLSYERIMMERQEGLEPTSSYPLPLSPFVAEGDTDACWSGT